MGCRNLIRYQCGCGTNQNRGQSWPNVRSNQKYKSKENCHARYRSLREEKTRTVAKARPKLATVKKAAQKEVAPAVETVEHPALEFEEVRQVSSGPDEM